MLVYVDTSVFGGVFDPEFDRVLLKWRSALLFWMNSSVRQGR